VDPRPPKSTPEEPHRRLEWTEVPPLQRRERTYEFQPSGDPIQSKTAVNTSEVDITPREDIGFADNFTFANFRTPI
jgi:hypothetical protein